MLRFTRLAALSLSAMWLAAPLAAQNTPAPPNWQDGHGASVYLETNKQTAPTSATANNDRYAPAELPASAPAPRIDAAVAPAIHETPAAAAESSGKRLAPPTVRSDKPSERSGTTNAGAHRMLDFGIPTQSMYTVATALAIVIGAFLLFAWALRRGGKNGKGRRGMLPSDAVSVLGRVPLAARQFAELLRVGNKLVLVAMTPSGPTTLTEVTDPLEVDRLVGLCQQFDSRSTTQAFEQVFQQLSNEPVSGGFLGGEPMPMSLSPAASAYRSHRGTSRA